jgi:hypothetical protein
MIAVLQWINGQAQVTETANRLGFARIKTNAIRSFLDWFPKKSGSQVCC